MQCPFLCCCVCSTLNSFSFVSTLLSYFRPAAITTKYMIWFRYNTDGFSSFFSLWDNNKRNAFNSLIDHQRSAKKHFVTNRFVDNCTQYDVRRSGTGKRNPIHSQPYAIDAYQPHQHMIASMLHDVGLECKVIMQSHRLCDGTWSIHRTYRRRRRRCHHNTIVVAAWKSGKLRMLHDHQCSLPGVSCHRRNLLAFRASQQCLRVNHFYLDVFVRSLCPLYTAENLPRWKGFCHQLKHISIV